MPTTDTRQAKRTPVTLKIKFKSETLDQFIERYSVDISHGGIFIRTKDPLAVGTTLRFEFQLKDATPLILGEGTVVWTREHDPARGGVAPGMGVRFDKLPGNSQKVLEQILAQKAGTGDAADEEDEDAGGGFVDTPTRVAPADLVDQLASDDYGNGGDSGTKDQTPLPTPMPFHSDADDFPDEAFEESTRVASLDVLAAATRSRRESAAGDGGQADVERAATTGDDSADDLALGAAGAAAAEEPAATKPEETAAEAEEPAAAEVEEPAEAEEPVAAEAEEPAAAEAEDAASADEDSHDEDSHDEDEPVSDRAEVAPPPDRDQDGAGSSMPWIAVAAVLLVAGGVGGFWFLNQERGQDARAQRIEAAAPADEAAPAEPEPAEVAAAEEPEEPEEPAVGTVDVEVSASPEGASVAVVGGTQEAAAPATLQLEEGARYQLEVSAPGHVSQVVEIEAGEPVPEIELVAMKKIVRISSRPPGAKVTLEGRRQKGATPLDVTLDRRLAASDTLSVVLGKPGFQPWRGEIATEGFREEDGVLVQEITAALERRQVAARRRPSPKGSDDAASEPKTEAKPEAKKPEPTPEAKPEAKKPEPEPEAKKPEPKPEAKPPEPKPTEPKPAEPTPDWMQ